MRSPPLTCDCLGRSSPHPLALLSFSAMSLDPEEALAVSAWVRRGRHLLLSGHRRQARAVLQLAVKAGDRAGIRVQAEALALRGCLSEQERLFGSALEDYRAVVALDVESAMELVAARLGHVLVEVGEAAAAEEALRKAVAIDADDPLVLNDLGRAYFAQGRLSEAVVCHRAVLEMLPGLVDAHLGLARISEVRGEAEQAIGLAREAHEQDGEDAHAIVQLARLEHLRGHGQEVRALLSGLEGVDLDPVEILELARLLEAIGHGPRARVHLEWLERCSPRTPSDWSALIQARARLAGSPAGLEASERGLKAFPDHPELLASRIGLLVDEGDLVRAAEEGQDLATVEVRAPGTIEAIVQTLSDAFLEDAARSFLERVIRDDELDGRLRTQLLRAHPRIAVDPPETFT